MRTTESQTLTDPVLSKIAWRSAQDPQTVFHSLMHHFNVDAMRRCYQQLGGRKAVGTDGVTKAKYGEQLDTHLEVLVERLKRMGYRPEAVRQVQIPKEGKPGATRPLGISNFEDKLVQKRMQELLEAIYEPVFLDCSYGFRPGRGCHDAIRVLADYLYQHEVETVIDVDLANFFGNIDRGLLIDMLSEKLKDTRLIRYLWRMFKAGVLAEGELVLSDEGVTQGSCCSPVLANIFAHYVIDVWFNDVVKHHCKGRVQMYRYADDIVILCRYASDAHRIKQALSKRLDKYHQKLNEEKTKFVSFSKLRCTQGVKQGTFDFLGFTFYLGRARSGLVITKLKTSGKRLRSKLKKVNTWARCNRNRYKLREVWARYCSAMRGHIQYYGVSHNILHVTKFVYQSKRIMFKWLNRRSQRKSFNWDTFSKYIKQFPIPAVKVHHRLF